MSGLHSVESHALFYEQTQTSYEINNHLISISSCEKAPYRTSIKSVLWYIMTQIYIPTNVFEIDRFFFFIVYIWAVSTKQTNFVHTNYNTLEVKFIEQWIGVSKLKIITSIKIDSQQKQ